MANRSCPRWEAELSGALRHAGGSLLPGARPAGLDAAAELQPPAPTRVPRYTDLEKPGACWLSQRAGFRLYASVSQAFQ